MPKLNFVKAARKDNPVTSKGGSYYWWKFRYGGKQYSKDRPPRSRLTQSDFLSQLWDLEDNIADFISECETKEDVQTTVENARDDIQNLTDECQESLDNMPEHLQESSMSGELLTERIGGLEEWGDCFDNIDIEDYEGDLDEIKNEVIEEIVGSNPGLS